MSAAETLKRLITSEPQPVDFFAPLEEGHHLHPISWVDQMVLDTLVQECIVAAKDHKLSEASHKALTLQVLAIGTVQMSLRKGKEAGSPLVYPSMDVAAMTLRRQPELLWKAFEHYAAVFEVTDEEKKL